MKKPDEIALYAFMRCAAGEHTASTDEAADALGICRQRAHYLVQKWRGKAWCDGVSSRRIYFDSNAPEALTAWGVVA